MAYMQSFFDTVQGHEVADAIIKISRYIDECRKKEKEQFDIQRDTDTRTRMDIYR